MTFSLSVDWCSKQGGTVFIFKLPGTAACEAIAVAFDCQARPGDFRDTPMPHQALKLHI